MKIERARLRGTPALAWTAALAFAAESAKAGIRRRARGLYLMHLYSLGLLACGGRLWHWERKGRTNNGTVSGANVIGAPVTVRSEQIGANFGRSNQVLQSRKGLYPLKSVKHLHIHGCGTAAAARLLVVRPALTNCLVSHGLQGKQLVRQSMYWTADPANKPLAPDPVPLFVTGRYPQ